MAQKQKKKQQLLIRELGSKLDPPPSSKHSLLNLLKQGVTSLSDMEQNPPASVLESMQPFFKAIVIPELLKHLDKDVKLLVASCLCEITRITAPEAPYSDDILKDVFGLIVSTFSGLSETSGPAFGRRVIMLETLARYRSCVVMLDLECDDLISEMFRTFLSVARDDHPENVIMSMRTIMFVLLDESEDILEDLLLVLLSALGRIKGDATEAGRKLAMDVIGSCAIKLEPAVKQFLISSMSEDAPSNCQIDYREVIHDLYRCSPQILGGVVPYLTGELLNDQTEARVKAVNLVGELFAIPGSVISEAFQSVFVEFLKRLTDRVVEVRMTALDYVKRCLISDPARPEASQIFGALCDRLLDFDENVRKQVVAVVCDVACCNLTSVPVETRKLVADRLRDKSLLVKRYTLDRLAEIYKLYCLRSKDVCIDGYDWIPGKILRCFYDKDFRSDAIESILCGALFPAEFIVKEIVEHWIRILAGLDKIEVKALEKILEQKQRLQQEMQKYLSLKQTYKDADVVDYQKKVIPLFRVMSRFFTDPAKAEEGFLALDQLKDANIWKILLALLDPNTTFLQAHANQEELLKILGEKHRVFNFLNALSVKCSYMLFSKEHVREILSELAVQKSTDNSENCVSCVNMLVILASYSPLLLVGSEEDLLQLLEDDNEIVKEGVLHVLARAGGTIREKLASSSSSVDLMLERLCVEGTRRQAKYAVHALAAITKDDGLRSLSVLCKRLVDLMDEKTHLPTVLQSLGCIAQTAMAVYETRESEIVEYIKSKILKQSHKAQDNAKDRWRDQSELCQLKIFGIKTLVKSYLPVKDAHLRGGIDSLIEILRNMLSYGEVSKELESSSVDKAHLKLASAKAILRLSRYWENKIPVDVFHLALRIVEIKYRQARRLFLSKVHQYIKDRVLDAKYSCVFLLDIFASKHTDLEEDKRNLGDILQMCRQIKARQHSLQSDASSQLPYPECLLPFLVHALAHHPLCPEFDQCRDVKVYEPLYRVLYVFVSMVACGDEDTAVDANNTDKGKDIISAVISILQCVQRSEDVVDPLKSKNSLVISELGLLATKRFTQKSGDNQGVKSQDNQAAKSEDNQGVKSDDNQGVTECTLLPSTLYKPIEIKEDNAEASDVLTWLAEEPVVAHFQSLALDFNATVHLDLPQDELLEDMETEGTELPLGKLIKQIKSRKNKSKEVAKNHSSPSDSKNDVDILKVVRDISLDNLDGSSKIEASNGHGNHMVSETKKGDNKQVKKREVNYSEDTPIPKRKRSSSSRSPSGYSSSRSVAKASVKARSSMKKENVASQSDLLLSPNEKRSNGQGSKRSDRDKDHDAKKEDVHHQKKAKLLKSDTRKNANNDKTSTGSLTKQKRKSVFGLAKCTSKEGASHTTDLVDCRIKVWWPMDKQFYEGVVKSYDPEKRKHMVLYNDGEVEVLCLEKERWELLDDGQTPRKKASSVKSPSKIKSPKKKKSPEGSGQKGSIKRSSSVKGKKAAKKSSNRRKQGAAEEKSNSSEEVENKSDVSSDVDELESGDHVNEMVNELPAIPACDVENSETTGQEGERASSGADSEESGEEADSNQESGQDKSMADGPQDSHDTNVDKSHEVDTNVENSGGSRQEECVEKPKSQDDEERKPDNTTFDVGNTEDAEDEPLSIWKRRVGKSRKKE